MLIHYRFLASEGNEMLHSIYLDYNPFQTLPAGVFPPSLTKISLQWMPELSTISDKLFDDINILKEVNDEQNLFHQDSKAKLSELYVLNLYLTVTM